MKKIFLTLALAIGLTATAQVKVGDNVTTLNASSLLELESTSKGLLFPRVALTGTTAFAPLAAHVAGMTVYNTATAGDVTPGLYTNDGAAWVKLGGSSSPAFSSVTYTKTSAYTSLNTAEVTPNNITTIVFSGSGPGNFTITDLPTGAFNVGKVLNIYNGTGTNVTFNFNRGGDGISQTNFSAIATRGYSFVWDGIGWARTSY
jgi:hypothetical protein